MTASAAEVAPFTQRVFGNARGRGQGQRSVLCFAALITLLSALPLEQKVFVCREENGMGGERGVGGGDRGGGL